MTRNGIVLLLVLVTTLAAVQAQAFDGERKGFMLNLGGGMGKGEITLSNATASISADGTGFISDFKIGGGANEQMMIYYTNRALWYSVSSEPGVPSLVNGMSALGVSYFLEPTAPSAFFSGALGFGVLTDSEATDSDTGPGFTIGVGFEFSTNWIVEATYMSAKVFEENDLDVTVSNVAVTISWFAY